MTVGLAREMGPTNFQRGIYKLPGMKCARLLSSAKERWRGSMIFFSSLAVIFHDM